MVEIDSFRRPIHDPKVEPQRLNLQALLDRFGERVVAVEMEYSINGRKVRERIEMGRG